MKINRFEDIIAWQKAQDLAIDIYNTFGKSRDFGFKDQICRAAISISNNIAEGFNRRGDREFSRFLFIALGSCSEVRSMIYLAERLAYVDNKNKAKLLGQSLETSKIIWGLIRSMENNNS